MRAYVERNKIVIESMSAEEGRSILLALKASIESYDARVADLERAAVFALEKPRNMRRRAAELRAEAGGFRSLRNDAIALVAILEPVLRDRSVT